MFTKKSTTTCQNVSGCVYWFVLYVYSVLNNVKCIDLIWNNFALCPQYRVVNRVTKNKNVCPLLLEILPEQCKKNTTNESQACFNMSFYLSRSRVVTKLSKVYNVTLVSKSSFFHKYFGFRPSKQTYCNYSHISILFYAKFLTK